MLNAGQYIRALEDPNTTKLVEDLVQRGCQLRLTRPRQVGIRLEKPLQAFHINGKLRDPSTAADEVFIKATQWLWADRAKVAIQFLVEANRWLVENHKARMHS